MSDPQTAQKGKSAYFLFASAAVVALVVALAAGSGACRPPAADPAAAAAGPAIDAEGTNNDFYDNEPFVDLTLEAIEVRGEIAGPGPVDLASLPLRQVLVREAPTREGGQPEFAGAYVYQGPSLFDILRERILKKKNEAEFAPIVDLMVVVENAAGEAAVFSWGEIFYPRVLHRIIVARRAAPIVPTKTGDRWPMPERARVVAADDLVADRTIDGPVRITVLSAPVSFPTEQGLSPLRSDSFRILAGDAVKATVRDMPAGLAVRTMPSVFYGRGRGFHGINVFEGVLLREVLTAVLPSGPEGLRRGYLVAAGADGYRAVITVSELANRNDNGEFLLCDRGGGDGGRFTIYPGPDFFSDRAVKALTEIRVLRYGSD
jgi:hypothetical protein